MLVLEFAPPWKRFRANKHERMTQEQLHKIGRAAVAAFRSGSRSAGGGKSHKGSRRSASTAGQYPAVQTGALIGSLDYDVSGNSVTVGTNVHYSKYLRYGTRKMAERKMSDEALEEGMEAAESRGTKHWVRWEYGNP